MATKKQAAPKEPAAETAVAVQKPSSGAVALPFDFGKLAGEGMENMTSADQAVPFLRILQGLSPEVAKKDQKIAGASPGMFLDTVTKELHEELIVVPCLTEHLYVEWRPRAQGGGFVARHPLNTPLVGKAKKNEKGKLILPSGNELVETFYVAAMLLDEVDSVTPAGFAMLAFTSSGIQPYKKSIGELRKFPGAPLFAHRLRITTEELSNSEGTWANWVIRPANQPEGDVVFRNGVPLSLIDPAGPQGQLLVLAKQFKDDVAAGAANIAYDTQADASTDRGSDDKHF
jgi:hypothetical protein